MILIDLTDMLDVIEANLEAEQDAAREDGLEVMAALAGCDVDDLVFTPQGDQVLAWPLPRERSN